MRILVTGSSGFIGSRIVAALRAAGHHVLEAVRQPRAGGDEQIEVDFSHDVRPQVWRPRLEGVDMVVNTVGILRESRGQSFSALHIQAPRALFEACVEAGVAKVIQISALGADEGAFSRYHVSKANADRWLMHLPLAWVVLRPSLVFGLGGRSARLFTSLSALPIVPVIGRGEQAVQPVHVDDLVELCVRIAAHDHCDRQVIDVTGPQRMQLREMLLRLRAMLGLKPPRLLPVPQGCVRMAARLSAWWPGSMLDRDTVAMLARGSTADNTRFAQALGRAPRAAIPFVELAGGQELLLAWARSGWSDVLLRWSLALVWIVTGLLSFGLYPVDASLQLLARTGLSGTAASIALYGAAALDLALGLGLLLLQRRTWLWRVQFALILGYSVVIAAYLPEFWLHPFGPLLKNLVLLAVIAVLHERERR